MIFITTFPEHLTDSGKQLIDSLKAHYKNIDIVIFSEVPAHAKLAKGVWWFDTGNIPTIAKVAKKYKNKIHRHYGGEAPNKPPYNTLWNKRWFGWFHKVAVVHYMLQTYKKPRFIFLDSDIRCVAEMPKEMVPDKIPIAYFKGLRDCLDSAILFIDGRFHQTYKLYDEFMETYVSGAFLNLPRWDDIFVMQRIINKHPTWAKDLAKGIVPKVHKNRSGHQTGGQIICQTKYGQYFEHEKGIHWRKGFVPK